MNKSHSSTVTSTTNKRDDVTSSPPSSSCGGCCCFGFHEWNLLYVMPELLGLFSLGLWIWAELGNIDVISKEDGNENEGDTATYNVSTAIRVIFSISILCSIATPFFLNRGTRYHATNTTTNDLYLPNRVIWLIFIPSWSLIVMLFVRLVVPENHFQTYPSNLDFGPKYAIVYSDTLLPVETNVAFDPEFNTFIHCIQGVLASLLAYIGNILTTNERRRQGGCCRTWTTWIVLVGSSVLTIYPTYNFIKRTIRSRDTFATSSFSNNATEWAFGFYLGVAVGQFLQALCYYCNCSWTNNASNTSSSTTATSARSNLLQSENGGVNSPSSTENRPPYSSAAIPWPVTIIQSLCGILLILTVFGAAVLYGYSWNNCGEIEEDGTECILNPSEGPDYGISAGLFAIPCALYLVMVCFVCCGRTK